MSIEPLRRAVEEGERTDSLMPIWLPFLPMIVQLIGLILTLAFMFVPTVAIEPVAPPVPLAEYPTILTLVTIPLWCYVLYKWIERRNAHIGRTRGLYSAVAEFFEREGLGDTASSVRFFLRKMETEIAAMRNTILLVVLYAALGLLCLFPVLGAPFCFAGFVLVLYIYNFLNKDFHKHDACEKAIWDTVNEGLHKLGRRVVKSLAVERIGKFPSRSTVLYFLLTLFTLTLFTFYWVYVLTKDPNEHFRSHSVIESEFLGVARS